MAQQKRDEVNLLQFKQRRGFGRAVRFLISIPQPFFISIPPPFLISIP